MTRSQPDRSSRHTVITAALAACVALTLVAARVLPGDPAALYAETFDAHWEALRDNYPFFELYSVDWDAERAEHRARAIAAPDPDEFAWEMARMISSLPDPHVAFVPAMDTIMGRWSVPDIDSHKIEGRTHVKDWKGTAPSDLPAAWVDDPLAFPEIIAVRGQKLQGVIDLLAGGPLGTSFDFTLRWPDGSETVHELKRPEEPNLPPPSKHYGTRWLISGRVGDIGYMRVQSFSPERGTLGPDGKMTTMLRAALKKLSGTKGLILDFQGNGGGQVAASDPFLGHLVDKRLSYAWGNAGGKKRVIRPSSPRYRGKLVALVDERSASGGEWAARILRDAGRATVVGGRTVGAEAAVHISKGPDGSALHYSAWPMIEPGRTPFQGAGIELDHALPLSLADVRAHGLDEALTRVRRARFAKALELLDAPASDLDAFLALTEQGDLPEDDGED